VIRIELPARPQGAAIHGYSALVECWLSLHVAFDRDGHPFSESRLRALRRLDGDLRRRLEARRRVFEAEPPAALLAWPGASETFEAGLARLREHEPELCDTLAGYWEESFGDVWTRIEPMLAEAVGEADARLAERGPGGLVDRLPPATKIDARTLAIEAPTDATVVASAGRPVRFAPSMFVWRRFHVATPPGAPPTVLYQAPASWRLLHPDAAPPELVEMLSALADDMRLRVLKLVAQRPRTAQELAPIVGMSTTGVSKSLRKLAEAGILVARREGYYVVYSLNTARLRSLPLVLEQFLRDSETRAA
jgi:DNA-binding transcriptional ArsR family regulator